MMNFKPIQWPALLVVGCLAIILPPASPAAYQLIDKVVAVAEDEAVLASEVRDKMQAIKTNLSQRGRSLPTDSVLYEQVLERLILDKLQLQRAFKLGLRVSDQELTEAMQSIASRNGLSLDDFRLALDKKGQSFVGIREQARQDILIQRVQQRSVMRSIRISPTEVDNYLSSDAGKALLQVEYSLDHLLLPLSADATDAAKQRAAQKIHTLRGQAQRVSQFAEISHRIESAGASHSPLGWRTKQDLPSIFEETVTTLAVGEVSQPLLSGSGYHLIRINQTRGGVDEESTETKVRHILLKENEIRDMQQSRTLMESLQSELQAGASFAELARKHSDDVGSALKGGELGWTLPGVMVPEFETQMLKTPVGELSEIFQSQFGWHILLVDDRRSKDMSNENARRHARMAIADSRYDDALNNWLQELRDNAFVEIK